jgi:diaminohydroxyphosphoribosylaminopyrimidine deaminase/5-amino-6-(5-phosphoribosylamino)uracil reductase
MSTDLELMGQALSLAGRARLRTPPNPWVGCVIVRDGEVVGEGATQAPGGAHAEVEALRAAGDRARGATAYVTLEPCAHHGRTPPCTEALIDAGVTRVVVALEDPDPNVSGRGIAQLQERGITVDVGSGADNARLSLAPYLVHRRTGRSFCLLKTAMSVDARIAAADGSSQWITGPAARADAHGLRADSQAVVVGAGTALTDRPSLTVRDLDPPVEHPPLRVVLDARGRVPATGALFDGDLAPTLVITTEAAPAAAVDDWRAAGAKVEIVPAAPGGVDLSAALAVLGGHGVLQAMVEGGPTVHGALLAAGLVDRLVVYLGAALLGPDGAPAFAGSRPATIAHAHRLSLRGATPLGDDVRLDYVPLPVSVAPDAPVASVEPEDDA